MEKNDITLVQSFAQGVFSIAHQINGLIIFNSYNHIIHSELKSQQQIDLASLIYRKAYFIYEVRAEQLVIFSSMRNCAIAQIIGEGFQRQLRQWKIHEQVPQWCRL